MSDTVEQINGVRVFIYGGPPIRSEADALDVIIAAGHYGADAQWAALPVGSLAPEFFTLSTGFAGMLVQKFVSYGIRLAIVGDVSPYTAESEPLAAFVRESNRGWQTLFVSDVDELGPHFDRIATKGVG